MNEGAMVAVVMRHGHTAICPACGGMMRLETPERFHCMDCGTRFVYLDAGIADKEITVKKVG